MEGLIARIYARYRERYLYLIVIVAGLFMWGSAAIAALVAKRVADLSTDEYWEIVIGVCAVQTVSVLAVAAYIFGTNPVIIRWLLEGPSAGKAEEAWRAGVALPGQVVRVGALGVMTPTLVAVLILMDGVVSTSASSVTWVTLLVLSTTSYMVAWVYMAGTLAVRPGLAEASALLPETFQFGETRPGSLPMAASVVALTYSSGVTVSGLTIETGTGLSDGLVIFVWGGAAALVFGVPLALFIVDRVFGPPRGMTKLTRTVACGDLTVRVPLVSDDEQGEIGVSFNAMLRELAATTDDLRASRARIVTATDQERRRLERDIHDGAQQRLILLQLQLSQIARGLAPGDPTAAKIERLRADVGTALDELRDLAHGIYPAVLESDGLPGALEEAAQRAVIPTSVECDGAGRYPSEVEAAVYFCCLEALQNAGKYAGEGARATIALAHGPNALRFSVTDDGMGFDPAATTGNHGLTNMSDRIGALGGALRIESAPGGGTTVAGTVPLTGQDQSYH